jgi:hypothetical protein
VGEHAGREVAGDDVGAGVLAQDLEGAVEGAGAEVEEAGAAGRLAAGNMPATARRRQRMSVPKLIQRLARS